MIRVVHVLGGLTLAGAESRIMDLYRHIDRNIVQFDFIIHTTEHQYYYDEIIGLGGHVYSVPRFKIYNLSSYKKAWKRLFEEHKDEWRAIQGHMTSTASIYLPIAKECGIPVTIAHARSAGVDAGAKGFVTRILRRNLSEKADYLFTCSELAGISVFGKEAVEKNKTKFIPNAIDVPKFKYNQEIRDRIRAELKLENRFVVGHVGRFHYAKNHEYLLKIFRDFVEDVEANENTVKEIRPALILLGEGSKMNQMKELCSELGIERDVFFLGNKTNVNEYYQAMDYFVYPSRYEGLPGTVVEAQAAGIPVLMSDTICPEVCFTDLVKTKSINAFTDDWAQIILEDILSESICVELREKYNEETKAAGFDISIQAKAMEEFYLNDRS